MQTHTASALPDACSACGSRRILNAAECVTRRRGNQHVDALRTYGTQKNDAYSLSTATHKLLEVNLANASEPRIPPSFHLKLETNGSLQTTEDSHRLRDCEQFSLAITARPRHKDVKIYSAYVEFAHLLENRQTSCENFRGLFHANRNNISLLMEFMGSVRGYIRGLVADPIEICLLPRFSKSAQGSTKRGTTSALLTYIFAEALFAFQRTSLNHPDRY